MRIELTADTWPLRGARSLGELNQILNDLHDHADGIDATAERLGIDRAVVDRVACRYQSLWMHY